MLASGFPVPLPADICVHVTVRHKMLLPPSANSSGRYIDSMEMDKLVSLCRRRGFLFQSSEIYGGLNGFWDYGPLGVELKRNVREAWWRDMVTGHNELAVPPGAPSEYEMTGLDCTHHHAPAGLEVFGTLRSVSRLHGRLSRVETPLPVRPGSRSVGGGQGTEDLGGDGGRDVGRASGGRAPKALKFFHLRAKDADQLSWDGDFITLPQVDGLSNVLGPDAKTLGTLTEPREFNLMFKTYVGALGGEESAAFLRPETAQGIFVNFKNVVDSTRVRVPFGIAQIGKSFRNEITPRNFTFRSREFEQMEIEFFCHPGQSQPWYQYWRDRRMKWYTDLGLAGERLRLREHDRAELSHYSTGTADIEYAFPFLPAGEFGELEGIAHRGDFDLRSHMEGKLDPTTCPLALGEGRGRQTALARQRQGPHVSRRPDR